jgi:hypothetical protein
MFSPAEGEQVPKLNQLGTGELGTRVEIISRFFGGCISPSQGISQSQFTSRVLMPISTHLIVPNNTWMKPQRGNSPFVLRGLGT